MLETERLCLRHWREADLEPYAAMMADPEVGYWLAGTMSREQCAAQIGRIETHFAARDFGLYAVERKADRMFLGFTGLITLGDSFKATPLAGGVEIGWRLARQAWGGGYATEAARAALAEGFGRLGLGRIIAITTVTNQRSRAVMERIGLVRDVAADFDHPDLPGDHPLVRHVVYKKTAPGRGLAEA